MAAWVEGGEHDTQVKHAAETAHKDARYQTTQDVGMFEYSPEISSDPVFLATIKGLWREVGREGEKEGGGEGGGKGGRRGGRGKGREEGREG